jgi:hypothetical protein
VASLESHNRKLRELLDSNDKLDSMKTTRKDTTWGAVFECIRGHAGSLHTAIKKSWNCNCISPHVAGLRLQRRLTGDDSDFNIAFNIPEEVHKLPTNAREIIISIKQNRSKEHKTSQTSPRPILEEVPSQNHYISKLRTNFTQSTPQLNVISRPGLKTSLSATPPPSLQAPLNDVSANAGLDKFKSGTQDNNGTQLSLTDSISR